LGNKKGNLSRLINNLFVLFLIIVLLNILTKTRGHEN